MSVETVDSPFTDPVQQREAVRIGMWAFLATEVMFFGALFLAYFYDRSLYPEGWVAASKHTALLLGSLNTALLLVSSLTMALSVEAAKARRPDMAAKTLLTTMFLGTVFLVLKGVEYAEHIREGLLPGTTFHFEEPASLARPVQLFYYLYFTMTGLHALHMLGGIVWLSILVLMSRRGSLRGFDTHVEVAGLYWHFIDVVWIFLFPMFYLVRGR
jgi:cytochrome c oxidase subunit 3